MQMLAAVTIVCWSIAAWLFWKWDIGSYRSEFQSCSKKEGDPESTK
jgi:hypothetical protein